MRLLMVISVALVLAPSAGAVVSAAALPTDVREGLAEYSIDVGPPFDAPARLPVSASRAKAVVRRHLFHGRRVGVYLVRITGHPGLFDPRPPGHAWMTIDPLQVGDLAWIVVVRGVQIPVTSNPGAPVTAVTETF